MNPLAHVTQTLLALSQSHRGNPKPPAPVNTCVQAHWICTHTYTHKFLDFWNIHICSCAPKQRHKQTQTNRGMYANIKHIKTHTKHGPQRPACGRWTFYVSRQRHSWSRDKTREREREGGKLQAKYCMFDLTKRYFQSRIQKFQPYGHNYLISKLSCSSFGILSMSCDSDTRKAIVRVIY